LEGCSESDPEEDPPGKRRASDDLEDEPPSKIATTRYRFFGDIPDTLWNDWKWQFRNRITRIQQLAQFIPLSTEEQTQLRLVTMRYPLSITPYYLSLIDPNDPDDPVRKQAILSAPVMTLWNTRIEQPLDETRVTKIPGLNH